MSRGWGLQENVDFAGNQLGVSADGKPDWIGPGVTIDWSKVTAIVANDVAQQAAQTGNQLIATGFTGEDIPFIAGEKVIRYGTVMCEVAAAPGTFGPYDPAASDGRQTLARNSFIMNRTVRESGWGLLNSDDTIHTSGITGGLVYKARLLANATAHSKIAGPLYSELESNFPNIRYYGV